ncbi:MAG: hypothetical protein Q9207_003787 [Kuettlingeria erythrocarpa]
MTAVRRLGEDTRRMAADLAGINARRICDGGQIEHRFAKAEDRACAVEIEHAVLQQQVETSQDDIWQAIEDIRDELERRADHLNDQHENVQCPMLHAERMDGIQTLVSAHEDEVETLKQRMDGAEGQASNTSEQVAALEEEMRRTAQETVDLLAQRWIDTSQRYVIYSQIFADFRSMMTRQRQRIIHPPPTCLSPGTPDQRFRTQRTTTKTTIGPLNLRIQGYTTSTAPAGGKEEAVRCKPDDGERMRVGLREMLLKPLSVLLYSLLFLHFFLLYALTPTQLRETQKIITLFLITHYPH